MHRCTQNSNIHNTHNTHCATFTDTLTSIGFLSSSLVLMAQVLPTSFSSIASMAMPCTRHGEHRQRRKEQHDAIVETLSEHVRRETRNATQKQYIHTSRRNDKTDVSYHNLKDIATLHKQTVLRPRSHWWYHDACGRTPNSNNERTCPVSARICMTVSPPERTKPQSAPPRIRSDAHFRL